MTNLPKTLDKIPKQGNLQFFSKFQSTQNIKPHFRKHFTNFGVEKRFSWVPIFVKSNHGFLLFFDSFSAGDVIKMPKISIFFQNTFFLVEIHQWSKFELNWTIFWQKIALSPGTTLSKFFMCCLAFGVIFQRPWNHKFEYVKFLFSFSELSLSFSRCKKSLKV